MPRDVVLDSGIEVETKISGRQKRLAEMMDEVKNIGDKLGKGIDEGIQEGVALLMANNINTTGSCEVQKIHHMGSVVTGRIRKLVWRASVLAHVVGFLIPIQMRKCYSFIINKSIIINSYH